MTERFISTLQASIFQDGILELDLARDGACVASERMIRMVFLGEDEGNLWWWLFGKWFPESALFVSDLITKTEEVFWSLTR